MGLETQNEGANKLYLYLTNSNTGEKGIYYKKGSDKVFVGGVSGEIINIGKEIHRPKPGDKWDAYWYYTIEFQDMTATPTNYILQIRRDNRATDNIINTLASLSTPNDARKIKITTYDKGGKLGVILKNHEDKRIDWKYQWDATTTDFKDIPPVKKHATGQKDAEGKEKFIFLRDEREDFLEQELIRVAILLTGKSFGDGQHGIVNNSTNENAPASITAETEADKLISGIKTNFKTTTLLLDKWFSLAARLREKVPRENQLETKKQIQDYLDSIKGEDAVSYLLNLDGTFTTSDDLPF